jgi:outer membrane lipoprotein-sorting protein
MKTKWFFGAVGLLALALAAEAQAPPPAGQVLSRLRSAYRACQSFRATATWTRKVGSKEMTATVTLAAQRPNKYFLEVKGEKVNTLVVSDGTTLVAYRPDRKAYTKTKAPVRLIGAGDILAGVDLPTPGARVLTTLLQVAFGSPDHPLGKRMGEAEISGPQGFGAKMAYVLTFPYDDHLKAKVYITSEDYLVRRITLLKESDTAVVETFTSVEVDKPVPAEMFAAPPLEDARLVSTLPPLEMPTEVASGPPAPDFTVQTTTGSTVRLSQYKGKIVLLNFFFNG